MNRSEGLIQRRNVNRDQSNNSLNKDEQRSIEEPVNKEREAPQDDNDSKETRLTLMEEVLLLGLKDKEVRIVTFCFVA